jgi:hypothetical protein
MRHSLTFGVVAERRFGHGLAQHRRREVMQPHVVAMIPLRGTLLAAGGA